MKYPFLDLKEGTTPYREELLEAVSRVVDSGRYIGGEENEAFERELGAMSGAEHCVGVSNGLDALRLIFRAAIIEGRLKEGDGVAIPSNTYIAGYLALVDAGLRPVPVEPDPQTHNISFEALEEVLKEDKGIRAVSPVHLYGRLTDAGELLRVAREYGLFVVEDCAQAIGAYDPKTGLKAGGIGDAGAFSFYPTKNVGALGDAGAVTTSDGRLAEIIRALSNYGSDRRYHNVYAGYNCRLDTLQAAMLRVKLRHCREENEMRRRKAELYQEEVRNEEISLPEIVDGHVFHQYVVRLHDRERRDAWQKALGAAGVGTDIHYPTPPHRQPCMANVTGHMRLPIAEMLADSVLSLPIGRGTTEAQVREIAGIINELKP